MSLQIASDEYVQARKLAHKEYKELVAQGRPPHPAVLDELLTDADIQFMQDVGLVEIPAARIVGTKSAGRITAFTPTFRPLLGPYTEFSTKWIQLCGAHLSDVGIREPIVCYEYLGNFYVVEGNKRVSVLRHFGAARIPANVTRVVPKMREDPRIKAYFEFIEFFRHTKLYTVQFRRPGDYARLLGFLGRDAEEDWTEDERRTFNAYFQYFREAFDSLNAKLRDVLPEEALLLWLQIHPYRDLGRMTAAELKRTLQALWPDVVAGGASVQTKPIPEGKPNLLDLFNMHDKLHVAFVHQLNTISSAWVMGHEDGRKHIESVFGDKIVVRSYFDANTPAAEEALLEQAVADGAQVVFTTAPKLSRETLKMAVKYPKVHFLNCSVDQPYSSVRTYYGRMYEAKFITGAIAGAMAQENRIGYIAAYPIFGEIASINAFALGAQLTNPRAQIELKWSCLPGMPQSELLADGVRVISNREVPTQEKQYLDFCSYGTYLADDLGGMIPLGSPVWVWGKFYEFVIRSIREGTWRDDRANPRAVNYWLGMDSGVISIRLADRLPAGICSLAKMLRREMQAGALDPFARRILTQNGTVVNDGTRVFTPDEKLKMNWLCENVDGFIPAFEDLLPVAQPLVRELGIYRDSLPVRRESL